MPAGIFSGKKIIVGSAAIGAIALFFLFYSGVLKLPKPGVPLASYSHPAFGVSFKFPENWAVDLNGGAFGGIPLRFSGGDGYFGIDALAANDEVTLENLLDQIVIKNRAVLYGTRPVIKSTVIDGLDARVVLPSDDQPEEAKDEALFIARYPEQVQIGDNVFRFFILYAHKDYLEDILRTLKFANAQVP